MDLELIRGKRGGRNGTNSDQYDSVSIDFGINTEISEDQRLV
jgi:hypothetical protein